MHAFATRRGSWGLKNKTAPTGARLLDRRVWHVKPLGRDAVERRVVQHNHSVSI
jgi:hypothetical protein